MSSSQRNACAISSFHVFQNEKSSKRQKGFNRVAARYWIFLKKSLVTQRVKGHRMGLQRRNGRPLNAADPDPVAAVFLWCIVVEHHLRVLLQIEMQVKVVAISLVHPVGRGLGQSDFVQGRQANHQIE